MNFLRWITGMLLGIPLGILPLLALADPPGRVARLAWSEGQVYMRLAGETSTHKIRNNWSLTAGQILQTDRFARAEMRIGSRVFRLDAESELEILRLDDERIQLRLNTGTLLAQVPHTHALTELNVDTPHGRLVWEEAGKLRLSIGHRPERATLAVFAGSAQFAGHNSRVNVRAGHQVEFYRDDINTTLASRSEFDRWAEDRDQLYASHDSSRYLSSEYNGHEELGRHGNWRQNNQYGTVWLPHDSSFTPFRDGEWTWLSPWGWTWVDHTPWAYVTSHYGRWVWLDRRWAWMPGQAERRPVWSPALVGWAEGGRPVSSPTFSSETSWFPLGPREIWWPAYGMAYGQGLSQNYLFRANRYHLPHGHSGNVVYGHQYQYYDHHHRNQRNYFTRYPRSNPPEHQRIHPAPPVGGRMTASPHTHTNTYVAPIGTMAAPAAIHAPTVIQTPTVAPAPNYPRPRHDPARYEGSNEDGNNGRHGPRHDEVRQNTPRAVVQRYEGSNEDGNNGRHDGRTEARPEIRQNHEARTEGRRITHVAPAPAGVAATLTPPIMAAPTLNSSPAQHPAAVRATPATAPPAAAPRAASAAPVENPAARAARVAEENERKQKREPNNRQAER